MEKSDFPKVLIISHNLYDDSNNIGKTLVSLFDGWPKDRLSQIYFRNDSPSFRYCDEYYCITDKDVLKSVMSLGIKKAGSELKKGEVLELSEAESSLYQVGNHRRPIVSFIRDVMWACGKWKTEQLRHWIINVANPDVILFAPNDYTLAYRVVLYIEKTLNKPIIPFYMDDSFYYGCKTGFIDAMRRKKLRIAAKKIHGYSREIFTICEYMSREYEQIFNMQCHDFVNSVVIEDMPQKRNRGTTIFSYLGNLHSNRWKSIVEIGRMIDRINYENKTNAILKVYSGSVLEKKVEAEFEKIESLRFLGRIPASEVREKQLESDVLIHVEAFDLASVNSTRLSLSTKIPEYLSTNRMIFAYGPSNIASMRYLKDYNLAITCNSCSDLYRCLKNLLLSDANDDISVNCYYKAVGSHDIKKVSRKFQSKIREYWL